MSQTFLEKLHQHQSETVKLMNGHGLSSKLNPLLILVGLHFPKIALPLSFILSLAIYLAARQWLIRLLGLLLFINQ